MSLIVKRGLGALPAVFAASALAQAPKAIHLGKVTVQGSIRFRPEAWDWFRGNADNSYAYSGNLLRLSLSQGGEHLDWQVEFPAPFLLGYPMGRWRPVRKAN